MGSTEIRKEFDQELLKLQDDLREMSIVVERMLCSAITALTEHDAVIAERVRDLDDTVDAYNIDIESRSILLFAREQPVARDLRPVAAALKMITYIERIGDYAVDIAMVAKELVRQPIFKPLEDIPLMARIVQEMLHDTIDAFISRDLSQVQQIISRDDEVDAICSRLHGELIALIEEDPRLAEQAVGLLMISRYLERIGDHITSMDERIYYMETGDLEDFHKKTQQ
jgi:phosphate transport system protein